METMIIKYDTKNKAIKQVLEGLVKLGAITLEKSPYSEDAISKIAKGDKELERGEGVSIAVNALWK